MRCMLALSGQSASHAIAMSESCRGSQPPGAWCHQNRGVARYGNFRRSILREVWMQRLIGVGLALLFPLMTLAAEPPPVCQRPAIPPKSRTPLEDLSGKLPVADYLDGVMSCGNLSAPGN